MLSLAFLLPLAAAPGEVATKNSLTLEGAKKAVEAVHAEARKNGTGSAVAVVDDGGNLLCLERLDGTFAAGSTVSIGKARTAALFRKETKFFEDVIKNGRTAMVTLPDSLFTPLQGGVPIRVGGEIVGAIGVSGASSAQQDEDYAVIGAKAVESALAAAPAGVTYLESKAVAAAFAKGEPLLEVPGYKIHASRRDGPGVPEVHERETDIVYVLGGSATLVTGGTVVEGKAISPGEIRGASIQGGDSRQIAKGDVVVVPAGMPHWFKEVGGPLTYYVVKVL
ncbi:MAG TPA: heme-binding protein [Planctomycetota bacterium]|nr:heme-binding protein [Planctomycetota bacterium]